MYPALHIIPTELLDKYISDFNMSLIQDFENLKDSALSIDTFSFYKADTSSCPNSPRTNSKKW